MTDRTPDLTIPGLTVAELRVRLDVLNKVLTELVGRITPADSEEAGLLWIAMEHVQAIAETVGTPGGG
jgi:hypothetical protein